MENVPFIHKLKRYGALVISINKKRYANQGKKAGRKKKGGDFAAQVIS